MNRELDAPSYMGRLSTSSQPCLIEAGGPGCDRKSSLHIATYHPETTVLLQGDRHSVLSRWYCYRYRAPEPLLCTGGCDGSVLTRYHPRMADLQIEDLQVGTGDEATPGHSVSVHYTGWLTTGAKFDSSLDRGKPFQFALGGGQVIKGWDQGVAGMKVGGKRKLTIPPELGYGARGAPGAIPPNSTLVFEVELLGVG